MRGRFRGAGATLECMGYASGQEGDRRFEPQASCVSVGRDRQGDAATRSGVAGMRIRTMNARLKESKKGRCMPIPKSRDAVRLLKADHREVESLFKKFGKASKGRKRALAKQICRAL